MSDEKELKYSAGLFNDYKDACWIIYETEKGRREGEVARIHGQTEEIKVKAKEMLNLLNKVKTTNIKENIPGQFRRSYLEREKEFTKEETDLFYSFDINDPSRELVRLAVLDKRDLFYSLWEKESDFQHLQDEEYFKNKNKKNSMWAMVKDYFNLRK